MALSVSAFPEPPRPPNEHFTNGDEGHSKNVVNTPRLLGLFGGAGSGASNKKPESRVPTRTGKVEPESDSSHLARGSPPATPVSLFPAFEVLPQQEYERELKLEEMQHLDPPRSRNQAARRAQLPPLPRRTTPSPVRLGPSNMTRLEIGAGTRSLPAALVHSKSNPAPVLVVQDWSPDESPSSGSTSALANPSRPLPSVPPSGTDSSKTGPAPVNAVVIYRQAGPIAGPSTHASAIPGPSMQLHANPSSTNNANSIAGPSKQASVSTSTSSGTTLCSVTPPSSKVLITQPPRGHKQNSSSLSMRYQPLIVDPSPSSSSLDASASSSTANATNSNVGTTVLAAPNPIRPLPRIPPSSSSILRPPASATSASSILSRFTPPPAPLKRPRTSPSSISGFSSFSAGMGSTPGPSSSSSASPRSAFENIPSSWASKPVDLNSSRPSSPPLGAAGLLKTTTTQHHRPAPLKMPRSRSYSRSRKERSLDSYTRLSGASKTPPGSARAGTSFTVDGGVSRSCAVGRIKTLPTVTVTGARPLTKKVSAAPTFNKQITSTKESVGSSATTAKKQTSLLTPPSSSELPRGSSPTRRIGAQMTISGPVSRTTKSDRSTTGSTPMATSQSTRLYAPSSSTRCPKMSPPVSVDANTISPDPATQMINPAPSLPIAVDAVTKGTETAVEQSREGSAFTPESTLEYFVDGPETDVSQTNRSPSPIRYARPTSDAEPGNWQVHVSTEGETTDDDLASSSASNSPHLAPFKRKRTQLRSYKMDYWPQMQTVTDLPDLLMNDSNLKESLFSASTSAMVTTTRTFVPPPSRSARRVLLDPKKSTSKEKEKKKGKEERKKKEKWSFTEFGASGSGSTSAPGTRNSSPERKGRSRQPRKLAEAMSLALGGSNWTTVGGLTYTSGRGATAGPVSRSRFTASSSEVDEVLDIRLPTFANSNMVFDLRRGGGPLPLEFDPDRMVEKSSTHSSTSPKMVTTRRRDEMADTSSNYASESSLSGLDAGLKQVRGSGRGMHTSLDGRIAFSKVLESDADEDAGEMPFMWLSRDKPPLKSRPLIPPPPPQRFLHRRVGSSEVEQPDVMGGNRGRTRNRSFTQQISPVPTASTSSMSKSSSVSTPLTPFGKISNQIESADHEVGMPSTFLGSSDSHSPGEVGSSSLSDTAAGKQKERLQERNEVVVMRSRRILEHGEYWEDNRPTQVVDVIPKLRTLKTDK